MYIYINPKWNTSHSIICRCPVSFIWKLQLQVWCNTSNKIYFQWVSSPLHPPEFIKTHNLYTTKSWFFAIKAACYIIGTTNQKGIYLHLLLKIKIDWPESKYLRKFLAIHNIPACNKSATSPCHRIDHVLYSWKKRW